MDKIVVLDGFTANPGDISWDCFKKLGELTVYKRTPDNLVVERAKGARIAITNKTVFSKEIIEALPELEYIGVIATGYNVVDIEAAGRQGIVVTNVPGYSTESVVQTVFAHLLNLTQRVAQHSESVRAGDWVRSDDFCYWSGELVELSGKTFGIMGFGAIGQRVAAVASALGMRVICYSRTASKIDAAGYEAVNLEKLFAESDVLSLNCPLTAANAEVVNAENLKLMKSSAFLINTARGGLVNEADLAAALDSGILAGAGVDVLSTEPPQADNPLLEAKNCYITPHLAWATLEARQRLLRTAYQNVESFQKGLTVNRVN
ncbi:D-2-hydroxyacid dehydrogenase [Lentisphaerota bacterium ZTH]|nr:D-2-hydroxyacid dehydrogenase [Lentisphaerota bacterium]WET05317.1 D-2-hydroxyacid dehydrogenase [Lentisphaerota bacterium ZTH]